jgi:type VI protein secretion system component Hcp
MSNSVAEAYLLILRPSFIPVIGEAVPIPFNEQIEIDEWNWTLQNDECIARDKARDEAKEEHKRAQKATLNALNNKGAGGLGGQDDKNFKPERLAQDVSRVQLKKLSRNYTEQDRAREIKRLIDNATAMAEKDDKIEDEKNKRENPPDEPDEDKLKFTFKKNVDAASTQLLNSFKAGDVMPKAIFTLFHRATHAPVTLVITFGKVTLKHYELTVDVTETMADMKETWTASFESVEWAYQNRPAAAGPNFVTKGTARVFKKGSLL